MTFFNKNIKFLREQKQLSFEQISYLCKIPVDELKSLEKGPKEPCMHELILFAEIFNYPLDRLILDNIEKKFNLIKSFEFKFLALDIDGVLTDGGVYYSEKGDELKKFNVKDGLAIKRLTDMGKYVGFISSGANTGIIENRAKTLGVHKVYTGTWKKHEILEKWCDVLNINLKNVAYIGDDINDLSVISIVGLSACPADAVTNIKENVNIILSKKGGDGCVREFVENYIIDIK